MEREHNTFYSEDSYFSKEQNCDENKYLDTYKVFYELYKYRFSINSWIKSLFKDSSYITDPSSKSDKMEHNYGLLYTGVDATMKSTKDILEQILTKIENETEFILKGNRITYYDPKRPISGEYHEDGIAGIKSFYEEQKKQKNHKKN